MQKTPTHRCADARTAPKDRTAKTATAVRPARTVRRVTRAGAPKRPLQAGGSMDYQQGFTSGAQL